MIFHLTKHSHQFFLDQAEDLGLSADDMKAHYILCCLLRIPCIFGQELRYNGVKIHAHWGMGYISGGESDGFHVFIGKEHQSKSNLMYRIYGYLDEENYVLMSGEEIKEHDLFPFSDLLEKIQIKSSAAYSASVEVVK